MQGAFCLMMIIAFTISLQQNYKIRTLETILAEKSPNEQLTYLLTLDMRELGNIRTKKI